MFKRAAIALVALVSLGATSAFADDFGARVPGQHVYDRAHVLRPDQVQQLETHAAALDGLGAPTVVFVRVEDASQAQVQREARELMDAWDVESSDGAHDGFVMLFDLTPGNTQRGQVGMFAGATHTDAELDKAELNRIATNVMRPSLANGDLVGGINAGLDAAVRDLQAPAADDRSSVTEVPELPIDRVLGMFGMPFLVPLIFSGLVVSLIRATARRKGGRSTSSSHGPSWLDSGSWSSGGGSDDGGASSGGDSGGSSF